MKTCEARGKELLDGNVIAHSDLSDWLKAKHSTDHRVIDVGLPCYAFLHTLLDSIKAGSTGLVLMDGTEVNHLNRPQDRLMDWFFNPILVLKEQIRALRLEDAEIRYLQKVLLFGNDKERAKNWDAGGFAPADTLRAAQIEGISRRMMGMERSASKFPTHRRRYRQVVKDLIAHSKGKKEGSANASSAPKEGSTRSMSTRSLPSVDIV